MDYKTYLKTMKRFYILNFTFSFTLKHSIVNLFSDGASSLELFFNQTVDPGNGEII